MTTSEPLHSNRPILYLKFTIQISVVCSEQFYYGVWIQCVGEKQHWWFYSTNDLIRHCKSSAWAWAVLIVRLHIFISPLVTEIVCTACLHGGYTLRRHLQSILRTLQWRYLVYSKQAWYCLSVCLCWKWNKIADIIGLMVAYRQIEGSRTTLLNKLNADILQGKKFHIWKIIGYSTYIIRECIYS